MDEKLDIVDDHDRVIGKMQRSEIYKRELTNFRVVNLFIRNSKGELWIPRRTADKRIFPLCLDFSVGGHVETGETYQQALVRETREELNINLHKKEFRLLGHLTPHENSVSAFMNVYELLQEESPKYNKHDFCESFWLTPVDIVATINSGDRGKAKDDLLKLINHFYV